MRSKKLRKKEGDRKGIEKERSRAFVGWKSRAKLTHSLKAKGEGFIGSAKISRTAHIDGCSALGATFPRWFNWRSCRRVLRGYSFPPSFLLSAFTTDLVIWTSIWAYKKFNLNILRTEEMRRLPSISLTFSYPPPFIRGVYWMVKIKPAISYCKSRRCCSFFTLRRFACLIDRRTIAR